jgi:hypothetical protein
MTDSQRNPSSGDEGILALGDAFLELRTRLEKDLRDTGFDPDTKPPFKEPRITFSLSELTDKDLRDQYDRFLRFYDYLTDEITRCEVYLGTTKARATTIFAAISLEVHEQKAYTNAETRKHAVLVHPSYLVAQKDFLYFNQLHSALEERRRKMSKSIDRIYREITFRMSDFKTPYAKSGPETKKQIKNMFRPVGPGSGE